MVQGLLALYASARYSWREAKVIGSTQVSVRSAGRAVGIQATLQLISHAELVITIDVAGIIQPGPGQQRTGE